MGDLVRRLWRWMQPRLAWLLPLIAVLLALPSLWGGFFMDDYAHLAVLSGRESPLGMTRWDLFSFANGNSAAIQPLLDRGVFPWWTSTHLKLAFWRPLTVLLMHIDYGIANEWAPFYHAHSILWFVVVVLAAISLYRHLLPSTAAGVAALLFVLDDAHAGPVIWIANRNAVTATALGLWALVAHHRARAHGWRPGWLLAPALLVLALLSGEAALAIAAYLVAYELWAVADSWRSRLKHLAPYGVVVLGYLALHGALGYGAHGGGAYFDPRSTPLAWLQAAPGRFLALLGGLLVNSPIDLWSASTAAKWPLAIVALIGLAFFAALTRRVWPGLSVAQRRMFRFLAGGALLSLIPVLSTFPSARLCFAASVGSFGCIAIVVTAALQQQQARATRRMSIALLAFHLIATLLWIPQHRILNEAARIAVQMSERIDYGIFDSDSLAVSLFAPDPISAFYPEMMRDALSLPVPDQRAVLSMSHHEHRYTRTADRVLELEVIDGALMEDPFERLVRDPSQPLTTGDRLVSKHMEVEVLAADDGKVTRVRFTFRRSLDDPHIVLMAWRDDGMQRIPTFSIGESLVMPASYGVFEHVLN